MSLSRNENLFPIFFHLVLENFGGSLQTRIVEERQELYFERMFFANRKGGAVVRIVVSMILKYRPEVFHSLVHRICVRPELQKEYLFRIQLCLLQEYCMEI